MNQASPLSAAIFLDRDGTIIEDVGHVHAPEQLCFLPRAIEALRALQRHYRLFIVTNQSGISLGAITPAQLAEVHAHLLGELGEHGIQIEEIYTCPHTRAEGCRCIKPEPYFLDQARRRHGVDLATSYVLGDHPHDVEFGRRNGARGIYLLTGHGQRHLAELGADAEVAADVWEAAERILRRRAAGLVGGGQGNGARGTEVDDGEVVLDGNGAATHRFL